MTQTIKVLNRNYLNNAEGTPVEATSVANIFRVQGTAVFVGATFVKDVLVEEATPCTGCGVEVSVVPESFSVADYLNMMNPTGLLLS